MPRELKTYGCDYRCGKTCQKRKTIEKHEQTCFANPARRACKTCAHDRITKPSFDIDADAWCDMDVRPENVNALADCPSWEAK